MGVELGAAVAACAIVTPSKVSEPLLGASVGKVNVVSDCPGLCPISPMAGVGSVVGSMVGLEVGVLVVISVGTKVGLTVGTGVPSVGL